MAHTPTGLFGIIGVNLTSTAAGAAATLALDDAGRVWSCRPRIAWVAEGPAHVVSLTPGEVFPASLRCTRRCPDSLHIPLPPINCSSLFAPARHRGPRGAVAKRFVLQDCTGSAHVRCNRPGGGLSTHYAVAEARLTSDKGFPEAGRWPSRPARFVQ